MSDPFAKPSDFKGASYFSAKDYLTALALLVEPKKVEHNVPSSYKGNVRERDEAVCDISVFSDQAALEKREPSEVHKGIRVTNSMLVSTCEKVIGSPMPARLEMIDTKAGSGYVFRDLDDEALTALREFYTKREADINEALSDAPSFD